MAAPLSFASPPHSHPPAPARLPAHLPAFTQVWANALEPRRSAIPTLVVLALIFLAVTRRPVAQAGNLARCVRKHFRANVRPDGKNLVQLDVTFVVIGERVCSYLKKCRCNIARTSGLARYYNKFYIALQNTPGSVFCFPDGDIHAQAGDAYWFDNSVPHSVHNHSGQDRLALIVCIKTDQFKDTPHA